MPITEISQDSEYIVREETSRSLNVCSTSHYIDKQNNSIQLDQAHDLGPKCNTDKQEQVTLFDQHRKSQEWNLLHQLI